MPHVITLLNRSYLTQIWVSDSPQKTSTLYMNVSILSKRAFSQILLEIFEECEFALESANKPYKKKTSLAYS